MGGTGTKLTRSLQFCGIQTYSSHFMEQKPNTAFHWGCHDWYDIQSTGKS